MDNITEPLLEDCGNCRTGFTSDLLTDSLHSEQQKLRQVLHWAQRFLTRPEAHNDTSTDKPGNIIIGKQMQSLTSDATINQSQKLSPSSSSYKKSALFDTVCSSEVLLKNNRVTELVYATVQSERDTSGHQRESSSSFNHDAKNNCDPEKRQLKISQNLTVYEQYRLCVDHLHQLRSGPNQSNEEEYNVPSKEKTTVADGPDQPSASESDSAPDINETDNYNVKCKGQTTADFKPRNDKCLATTVEKQNILMYNDTLPKYQRSQPCYYVNTTGEGKQTREKTPRDVGVDKQSTQDNEAIALQQRGHQVSRVKGQKKKVECSSNTISKESSLTSGKLLTRPQLSRQITNIKSLNAQADSKKLEEEGEVKCSSGCEENKYNPRIILDTVDTHNKHEPAGVPLSACWLSLPDELWLDVLSLLPLSDVVRVAPVCRRLQTLTADCTLWRHVRIEKCTLTDWWLLCVAKRRPQTVCLYSCSGHHVTSWGLRVFFYLCRHSLQEVKVTSCTGPGIRGDRILSLIGQLCHNVSCLDVSWSGATDKGLKALSDSGQSLRLQEIIVNGCQVTDDPLMALLMRHRNSLSRLEAFGCQFITPSFLENVYEMCPNLQYLNIGQVRKVNAHSLTVMALKLKNLISLNVTGLQAVSDAVMDTLLQNSGHLQSLTLSSCPGVTDRTLHIISKHTPAIRALDVSGCAAVTDAGVQSLALGCTSLQQLDLSSTATGNRGVTLLANNCSKHLHTVKLSFCRISPESILQLCAHCKRLKLLHVYSCAQVPTEKQIREVNSTVTVQPFSTRK